MSIINRDEILRSLAMKLRQIGRMQIGRLLGSVPSTDGKYKAWVDILERGYFMRAELNALLGLLVEKKVFTMAEWQKRLEAEFEFYIEGLAKDWPEVDFTDTGCTITDPQALAERSKRERWPP